MSRPLNTPVISQLPIPACFDRDQVGSVWRVPYQQRATEAEAWATQQGIRPASEDQVRVCLLAIDVQNTFCIPEFELFVGGRSGTGAIALWLKQRQTDLDITDQEFERFCDSYRLLPIKLQGIYEGREIDSSMLTPLSRVLGCSVEEVLQVLEG